MLAAGSHCDYPLIMKEGTDGHGMEGTRGELLCQLSRQGKVNDAQLQVTTLSTGRLPR